MKLVLATLLLQIVYRTHAQSDCNEFDTFDDNSNGLYEEGNDCKFYKGKDCVATAKSLGVSAAQIRNLLIQCPISCGFCGNGTIVKECKDDSCSCKDTPNWELATSLGKLTCSTATTSNGCATEATTRNLPDAQIRDYLTNCAFSCQTCRPCSDVNTVGDKFCDPGNNNAKCFKTNRKTGFDSAAYDGGDCCNVDGCPLDNTYRYHTCLPLTNTFLINQCRCLEPLNPNLNDCVGGYGQFGDCTVSCEAIGQESKTFTILHEAKVGGKPCEAEAGNVVSEPCDFSNRPCPITTLPPVTTTQSTTTTTTTAASTTTQAVVSGASAGSSVGLQSTTSPLSETTVGTANGSTSATTPIMTIALAWLLLRFVQ